MKKQLLNIGVMAMIMLSISTVAGSETVHPTAEKYMKAAKTLEKIQKDMQDDPYGYYKRQTMGAEQKIEAARASGMITQAEYEEAKQNLKRADKFIDTKGKSEGVDLDQIIESSNQIQMRHNDCYKFLEDVIQYQDCIKQS